MQIEIKLLREVAFGNGTRKQGFVFATLDNELNTFFAKHSESSTFSEADCKALKLKLADDVTLTEFNRAMLNIQVLEFFDPSEAATATVQGEPNADDQLMQRLADITIESLDLTKTLKGKLESSELVTVKDLYDKAETETAFDGMNLTDKELEKLLDTVGNILKEMGYKPE